MQSHCIRTSTPLASPAQTYTPLWTVFWDVSDYGVWKPILAHGSILAVCWLVGAFAAGAYSKDALAPKPGYRWTVHLEH
jgi:hypothetical protein